VSRRAAKLGFGHDSGTYEDIIDLQKNEYGVKKEKETGKGH